MHIECDVRYDPAADRLVGGDYLRELPKGWARSFLVTAADGRRLWQHLNTLDAVFVEEHGDGGGRPYARVLAIIEPGSLPGAVDGRRQMVPMSLAFAATPLRGAPPAYREPVQLICGVAEPVTLAERPPHNPSAFAAGLFGLLRVCHRYAHLALTRDSGSSVAAEALSPTGALQDPYYLVGPGDLPGARLREGQRQDLARGLRLTADRVAAVTAYWEVDAVPADVRPLLAQEDAGPLAAALLSGGW